MLAGLRSRRSWRAIDSAEIARHGNAAAAAAAAQEEASKQQQQQQYSKAAVIVGGGGSVQHQQPWRCQRRHVRMRAQQLDSSWSQVMAARERSWYR